MLHSWLTEHGAAWKPPAPVPQFLQCSPLTPPLMAGTGFAKLLAVWKMWQEARLAALCSPAESD